jgi:hypothetical protein
MLTGVTSRGAEQAVSVTGGEVGDIHVASVLHDHCA